MLKTQKTVHYKTYIKDTLVEAMLAVFSGHPDEILQDRVKVSTALPMTKTAYPTVLVRYYERNIHNMGVGHHEWLTVQDDDGNDTGEVIRYKHYGYAGDIEFAIYALSSLDRDLMADSVVQVLTMGDMESYSTPFYNRIYRADLTTDPIAQEHFINLSSDQILGYGESEMVAPWMTEDTLVYQTSYRIPISGEFYSRTPTLGTIGIVTDVELHPYEPDVGEVPWDDPSNPNPWDGSGNEFF